MHEVLSSGKLVVLIALGASLGAFFRESLSSYIDSVFTSRYLGTLTVNIVAAFCLGIVFGEESSLSTLEKIEASTLLVVSVGFLGSFSTFSSFIGQLLNMLIKGDFAGILLALFCSIFGGFLAVSLGYHLVVSWPF